MTERNKLEEHALFELIIQSSDDAIISKDLNGIILSWNKGAEKLFGYTPEEIIGKHITTIIPEALRGEEKEIMQKIRSGQKIDHYETERVRKDGTIINASLTISPVKDVRGKIIGASKILRDTTEYVKTNQKLKKSELFNIGIINALQAHIAVLDNEGTVVMVNEHWKQFILNSENDLLLHAGIGSNYFKACKLAAENGSPDAVEVLQGIKAVLADNATDYYHEYALIKHGHKYWFALRVTRFDNSEPMVVISHEDITKRKLTEEKVASTNEELRLLSAYVQNVREEERIQIARDIHDELGQELTGLKMDLYDLEKKLGVIKEPAKKKLAEIAELIDVTVMSVRKIASNLRPSVLDDLGLVPALEWQSKEVENRFGISINLNSDIETLDVDVNTATGLFRIYQEALTNAVKHSNAHTINGNLTVLNSTIVLEIKDDGKGMDLNRNYKGHFGILGIKERAFVLGGICEIKSSAGKGTHLKVSVPVKNN